MNPPGIAKTSTILGQEVAERVLEDVHVREGHILGILFVLLIQKYYILFYFILFYFILFLFYLYYIFIFFYFSFLLFLFYFYDARAKTRVLRRAC